MSAATEYYGYLLSQGYGEHQINTFAEIAGKQEAGIISPNQAYRMACKEGFNNMTQQEAQDKCERVYEKSGAEAYNECVKQKLSRKSFGDWMQTAQDAGWIDKGLGLLEGVLGGQQQQVPYEDTYYAPPPKSKLPFIIGGLAVVGIGVAIYFATRKK